MNGKIFSNMNQNQIDAMLSRSFPDVVELMKKVRSDNRIKKLDKQMIEEQLINLCGSLHDARMYELKVGVWRDGSVYSDERAFVASGQTIRNETIFTIVTRRKRRWGVYIDLPVSV